MLIINFGSPGCGKTTLAVRTLLRAKKRGLNTFANFGCSCADYDNCDLDGLGEWTFPKHSVICIDEAGIEYNNRSYKTFPKTAISWYKKHRHHIGEPPSCVHIYSQSWEDVDVTLRRLADRLFYMKKIGPFTLVRRVHKCVEVDKVTHQIIDGYKMTNNIWLLLKPLYYLSYAVFGLGFLIRILCPQFDDVSLVLRMPYYKYFDTHEGDGLPLHPRFADCPTPLPRQGGILARWRFFPLLRFGSRGKNTTALPLDDVPKT